MIFADGIEHLDKRCLPSFVYLGFYVGSTKYPEEHDACKTCSKRADVDRQHIHPIRDDPLDQQRDDHTDPSDDGAGCFPAKSGLFLNRCDRSFIKVHQRCHSCKEDCGEEEDGDQPSARHGTDQMRQEDE